MIYHLTILIGAVVGGVVAVSGVVCGGGRCGGGCGGHDVMFGDISFNIARLGRSLSYVA